MGEGFTLREKIEHGVAGAVLIALVASIGYARHITNIVLKNESYKEELISKLRPHVEMVDKQPGISFKDQIDLAIRARVPIYKIMEGQTIDFKELSTSELETALRSYQGQ